MLRWNCKDPKQGCYYEKCCAKFNVFADCFPRGINFGDVDGIVEIGEKGLILEWKRVQVKLNTGPRLMYERLTKTQLLTTFVVSGNPETMIVDGLMIYFAGKTDGWKPATIDIIKQKIRKWISWANEKKNTIQAHS